MLFTVRKGPGNDIVVLNECYVLFCFVPPTKCLTRLLWAQNISFFWNDISGRLRNSDCIKSHKIQIRPQDFSFHDIKSGSISCAGIEARINFNQSRRIWFSECPCPLFSNLLCPPALYMLRSAACSFTFYSVRERLGYTRKIYPIYSPCTVMRQLNGFCVLQISFL